MDPKHLRELAEWLALRDGPSAAERAAWASFAAAHLPRIGSTIVVRLNRPYDQPRLDSTEPLITSVMAADLDRWFAL